MKKTSSQMLVSEVSEERLEATQQEMETDMIYLLQVIIKNFISDKESKTKEIISNGAKVWRNIMTVYGTFIAPVMLFYNQLLGVNFAFNLRHKNVFTFLKYLAFIFIFLPVFLNWSHMFKMINKKKSKTPEKRLLNIMQEKYFN